MLNAGEQQYFADSTGTIPLDSKEGGNTLEINANDLAGNSSSKTINYTYEPPSGTDDEVLNSQITFHPNPVNGIGTFTYPSGKTVNIEIYDASGLIINKIQDTDHNGETQIEFGNWNSGLYMYRLIDSEGIIYSGRVMKQ
jgi:hypothetical protein